VVPVLLLHVAGHCGTHSDGGDVAESARQARQAAVRKTRSAVGRRLMGLFSRRAVPSSFSA
jgi:hypothetical protein